jgi:hypothetical protein
LVCHCAGWILAISISSITLISKSISKLSELKGKNVTFADYASEAWMENVNQLWRKLHRNKRQSSL